MNTKYQNKNVRVGFLALMLVWSTTAMSGQYFEDFTASVIRFPDQPNGTPLYASSLYNVEVDGTVRVINNTGFSSTVNFAGSFVFSGIAGVGSGGNSNQPVSVVLGPVTVIEGGASISGSSVVLSSGSTAEIRVTVVGTVSPSSTGTATISGNVSVSAGGSTANASSATQKTVENSKEGESKDGGN